jgi:hypothetical protein
VVAGARGDDTGGALLRQQTGDPHVRAAQLERARPLEVLALEVDLRTDHLGQVPAALHRGHPRHTREHLLRAAHVVEGDGPKGVSRAVAHDSSIAVHRRERPL